MTVSEENWIVIKSLIKTIQNCEQEIIELNKVREEYNNYYEKTKNSQLDLSDLDYISNLLEKYYEENIAVFGVTGLKLNKQLQNKINKIKNEKE